jgi:hypothetical protein
MLKWMMDVADDVMKEACMQNKHPETLYKYEPVFSFDCWSGHNVAEELNVYQGVIDCRMPLCPGSPDIHKVIEHVFNRLDPNFTRQCWLRPSSDDVNFYAKLAWELLQQEDIEAIRRDILSMRDTCLDIVSRDGAWASSRLR